MYCYYLLWKVLKCLLLSGGHGLKILIYLTLSILSSVFLSFVENQAGPESVYCNSLTECDHIEVNLFNFL